MISYFLLWHNLTHFLSYKFSINFYWNCQYYEFSMFLSILFYFFLSNRRRKGFSSSFFNFSFRKRIRSNRFLISTIISLLNIPIKRLISKYNVIMLYHTYMYSIGCLRWNINKHFVSNMCQMVSYNINIISNDLFQIKGEKNTNKLI